MKCKVTETNKDQHKWWHVLFGFFNRYTEYRNGPIGWNDVDYHERHCRKCEYVETTRIEYE